MGRAEINLWFSVLYYLHLFLHFFFNNKKSARILFFWNIWNISGDLLLAMLMNASCYTRCSLFLLYTCRWSTLYKNLQFFSSCKEAFDTHIDLHLFLQTTTAIVRNISRDLFWPIVVSVCKNKWGLICVSKWSMYGNIVNFYKELTIDTLHPWNGWV